MKFFNESDRLSVEAEALNKGLPLDEYLVNRDKTFSRFRDFKTSKVTKQSWRQSRSNHLKGLKRFHKSTQGKKFHRELGKFISQRLPAYKGSLVAAYRHENPSVKDQVTDTSRKLSRTEQLDSAITRELITVNSIKTHLLIEKSYTLPFEDHLAVDALYIEVAPRLDEIMTKLALREDINEDDFFLLNDLWERDITNYLDKDYTDESV